MSEPFLGQITMFGGNFAIRGWATCDGQILSINQNQALFSLLGTTYGGDGRTTFGLPDLRGRAPMHFGGGPGLTDRPLGQKSGTQSNTLTVGQLPAHTHAEHPADLKATANPANTSDPTGAALAIAPAYNNSEAPAVAMRADSVVHPNPGSDNAGSGQAHNNMQPFQTINFLIALQGIFPSRN
jgi:microcystin-dependent protein